MFSFRLARCPQRARGAAWRGASSACAGGAPVVAAQWVRPATASAFDPDGTGHRQRAPGVGDLFVARRHHRRSRPRCDAAASGCERPRWITSSSLVQRSKHCWKDDGAAGRTTRCFHRNSLQHSVELREVKPALLALRGPFREPTLAD
ncbi:hypothetical protein MTO96_005584 [Rhipicephalus appendiculatus]